MNGNLLCPSPYIFTKFWHLYLWINEFVLSYWLLSFDSKLWGWVWLLQLSPLPGAVLPSSFWEQLLPSSLGLPKPIWKFSVFQNPHEYPRSSPRTQMKILSLPPKPYYLFGSAPLKGKSMVRHCSSPCYIFVKWRYLWSFCCYLY